MIPTSRREYWEEQLATCQQQPASTSSRATWLAHAYGRIYRFMLSQYASDEALPEQLPGQQGEQLPAEIDAAAPPSGMHSLGEVRTTLKSIRQAVPAMPLGALRNGINPHDWITLAYDTDQLDIRRCRNRLARDGFDCRAFKQAGLTVLQVRVRDFEKAQAWLAERREQFRPRPRRFYAGVYFFAAALVLSLPALAAALASWNGRQFNASAPLAVINFSVAVIGLLTLGLIMWVRSYPRPR